jgi:4-diphosphocytidyl-2-C-methyl-D-erythritol kinase
MTKWTFDMTMKNMATQLLAPAKINPSLRIIGRRNDGFHEIETLIAPISLADEIEIERQARWIDLTCDDPSLPCNDHNLVVRAAKAFFDAAPVHGGAAIKLRKRIPRGAGLGGGSSDAATTLLALNRIFNAGFTNDQLAKLGSTIGSDIPFFIYGSVATCRGRGENVTPAKLPLHLSLLLLKPDFGVPSGWAYSRWRDSREIPGVSYQAREFNRQQFVNDLERPVFEKFVFLAELKIWLLNQPEVGAALMSGSGSTMFAVLRDGVDGDSLAKRAKKELDPDLWTFVCTTS